MLWCGFLPALTWSISQPAVELARELCGPPALESWTVLLSRSPLVGYVVALSYRAGWLAELVA